MMLSLAQGFMGYGFNVDLVLAQAKGPLLDLIPEGVNVVNLGCRRTLTSLPKLVRYLRRERPNGLLATTNHANLVAIWARLISGVPMRLVIREAITFLQSAKRLGGYKKRITPWLMSVFYPWADAVVAISEGVARELTTLKSLPANKIHVVYSPVITPAILELYRAPLVHPWLDNEDIVVVLGVGRLHVQKDFATLLKSFALVRSRANARLIILGEGDQRGHLELLAESLGIADDVYFPGFVVNPFPFMAKSSVFVLSSLWEGFGNVLVEALASGTQVVATDCPSGPAEILARGKYGYLVPIADHEAMADAILLALNNRGNSDELIKRGLQFSQEKAVQGYLNLLEMPSEDLL